MKCSTRFGVPVMDPAVKRLMDNLPKGDPDAQPPDEVEVWLAFCEQKHVVPAGVPCQLLFGPWAGPPMELLQVHVHVRNRRSGAENQSKCGTLMPGADPVIQPGGHIFIKSGKGFRA